jgi:hypothetical protein
MTTASRPAQSYSSNDLRSSDVGDLLTTRLRLPAAHDGFLVTHLVEHREVQGL